MKYQNLKKRGGKSVGILYEKNCEPEAPRITPAVNVFVRVIVAPWLTIHEMEVPDTQSEASVDVCPKRDPIL
jgi:hypothetical protein